MAGAVDERQASLFDEGQAPTLPTGKPPPRRPKRTVTAEAASSPAAAAAATAPSVQQRRARDAEPAAQSAAATDRALSQPQAAAASVLPTGLPPVEESVDALAARLLPAELDALAAALPDMALAHLAVAAARQLRRRLVRSGGAGKSGGRNRGSPLERAARQLAAEMGGSAGPDD